MNKISARPARAQVHKKKYFLRIASVFFSTLFVIGSIFSFNSSFVYAATYTFTQSTWAGGVDLSTVVTSSNITNWTKYDSASTTLSIGTDLSLTSVASSTTDTSDANFNAGTLSSLTVASGSVGLTQGTGALTALSPATIATGSNSSPQNVIISADGTSAYAAVPYSCDECYGGTTKQYSRNTSTGALTALSPATIATGSYPFQITISADGTSVYVTNQGSNTISMYSRNTSTGALTALGTPTIATGSTPQGITISADGTSVYVSNYTSANISMYSRNTSTGALTALGTPTIAAGSGPQGITISADGTSVYVANASAGTVSMYSRAGSATSGTYTSRVIDTIVAATFTTMTYGQTPSHSALTLKARAGNTATPDGTWTGWTAASTGTIDISSLSGNRYIQYYADFTSTSAGTLDSVVINYTQYNPLGALVSSVYDTGDAANLIARLTWTESGTTPGRTVRFQVRSSADNVTWTGWCGYASSACDGSDYFYTGSGNGVDLATNHALRSGTADRYFRYKVFLTSDGGGTPTVDDIAVKYVVNAAPNFDSTYGTNGVIVAQTSATSTDAGAVTISYSVRDLDTATGSVNQGQVTPSFEYNIGGGWVAIDSSALASGDTALKTVDGSIYNTYSATWFATSTPALVGTHTAAAQIRVSANDNEPANSTATAALTITLDVQAPTLSATVDASVNQVTLTTADESPLRYRLCNDAAFSAATDAEGNSCDWSALGGNLTNSLVAWTPRADAEGNMPIYIESKDYYGNVGQLTIVAPAAPTSFDLKDVSNVDIEVFKEFLSWGVFTATTSSAFGSYKVYTSSSTDATVGTLLATITDPAINYYVDTITTATSSTHYYKVVTTSTEGNISAYTATISDVPNGQGILDTTAPVITPESIVVAGATLKNTSAIVSFTTDELARGAVRYRITGTESWTTPASSLSYVFAHSISLSGLTSSTSYDVQVQATDVVSNESSWIAGPSFTTAGGPVISNVDKTGLSDNSVTITWNTTVASDSYVYYYLASAGSGATQIKGNATQVTCVELVCAHSVELTLLTANQLYSFYVQSTDADSNTSNTNDSPGNFTTTLDVSPPTIDPASITTPVISSNAVVITWQTDKLSTSQVSWGTATGVLSRTTVADLVPSIYHIVSLSSATLDTTGAVQTLTPETPYFYTVSSTGANGYTGTSDEKTFDSSPTGDVTIVTTIVGGSATNSSMQVGVTPDTTPPSITTVAANNMGAFDADVKIDVNEDVVAFVDYGKNTDYGSTEGNRTFSNSKLITLKRLTEGTEYHYKVTVIDKAGNTTSSADQTFKTVYISELLDNRSVLERASDVQDKIQQLIESSLPSLAPPFITDPEVISITEDSAVIDWKTNIKSNGSVRYATDEDYAAKKDYVTEISAGQDAAMSNSHSITLTGLTANTQYHVQARSFVFPQVVGKSADFTFSTKASPVMPSITEVNTSGFTVVWQTDDETSSIVEYTNLKNGEINRVANNTMTKYHSVQIQNLSAGTTFTVLASGVNKNGNKLEAAKSISVTTKVDITPPVISNFKVDNALVPGRAGFIQTVVGWQTDKPANSTVYYEEGAGASVAGKELANKVQSLDAFSTSHIMILANLKSGTVYRIKVVSTDQSGNTKTFGPTSIITPQQSQSVLDIIVKNFEDTFKFLGAKQ